MTWKSWFQNAAMGVAALAVVEVVDHKLIHHEHGEPPPLAGSLVQHGAAFAMAALLGVAYSRVVPAPKWGAESGLAFARLPMVASMVSALPRSVVPGEEPIKPHLLQRAAHLAFWGAMTGMLMRTWGSQETAGEAHLPEMVRRLEMPAEGAM